VQLEFFDVPSPCIGICQADEKGNCLGCLRSRNERQTWKDASNDDKQKVIKRCIQRKKRKDKRIEEALVLNKELAKTSEKIMESTLEKNIQPSLLEPVSKATITQSDDMDFGDFEL
jgi:predicted Fe-S protein YdhL (DUF1289 family)